MAVKIRDKNADKPKPKCGFCKQEDLKGRANPVIICERCNAMSHQECFNEHGGCPTTGCGRGLKVIKGGKQIGSVQRAPEPAIPAKLTTKQRLRNIWRLMVDDGPQGNLANGLILAGSTIVTIMVVMTTIIKLPGWTANIRSGHWLSALMIVQLALCVFRYWGWTQKHHYHRFPYDEP